MRCEQTEARQREHWLEAMADSSTQKGKVNMNTYKIVRHYYNKGGGPRTIETGLTLEQAQAHCGDPENSSNTCVTANRKAYTRKVGEWFDGYTTE